MKSKRAILILTAIFLLVATAAAQIPDTVFIEEMTWEEIRDFVKSGKTVAIIPAGGTEQNGPHMVLGKHNYVVRFAADKMARRLGNALVAPVLQFVPEGDYNRPGFGDKPGVITCLPATYAKVLEYAARSLKVHGFTDIIMIGDSGGNQEGITETAAKLNKEWEGTNVRVFPITDYYYRGREDYRAWLLAQFGYDDEMVGSHAGISDTSQVLYVHPQGIRRSKIAPRGGGPDSGVTGDPTKATAEIGRMGIEFKVNAGIRQYRTLKNPPARRGRPSPP